jgi:hypothetical protein
MDARRPTELERHLSRQTRVAPIEGPEEFGLCGCSTADGVEPAVTPDGSGILLHRTDQAGPGTGIDLDANW